MHIFILALFISHIRKTTKFSNKLQIKNRFFEEDLVIKGKMRQMQCLERGCASRTTYHIFEIEIVDNFLI